jgi:MFS family permease
MINRNFFLLLSGQFVSQIGDKFHMIALSFWVLKTTGSTAKMGAVLAASLFPSLIVGFFSGAFIDIYNRKMIIVGTDLLRGLVLFIFAILFYFEMMSFYIILMMQVILSVNGAFFDPAIPSVIPQIVDKKDLAIANSKHQFVNGISTITGAFLGGILVALWGYFWIFVLNAISFFLSACFEMWIQIPEHKGNQDSDTTRPPIFIDMQEGYLYILNKRTLMVLLFIVMVIHFFVGSIEVFMPVIADAISESGTKTLGFFHTAFGLGTISIAIFLSIKQISEKEQVMLFGSVFGLGFFYVVASFFRGTPTLLLVLFLSIFFLLGCCIICASVSFKTLLQKQINNDYAGRVFALAGSIGNASIPGAMIFYGFLLEKIEFQSMLLISGLLLMPISLLSYMLCKEKVYV